MDHCVTDILQMLHMRITALQTKYLVDIEKNNYTVRKFSESGSTFHEDKLPSAHENVEVYLDNRSIDQDGVESGTFIMKKVKNMFSRKADAQKVQKFPFSREWNGSHSLPGTEQTTKLHPNNGKNRQNCWWTRFDKCKTLNCLHALGYKKSMEDSEAELETWFTCDTSDEMELQKRRLYDWYHTKDPEQERRTKARR